jgi:hypothetical protein
MGNIISKFFVTLLSLVLFHTLQAQNCILTGKVENSFGVALPGAHCIISGHALYAVTDDQGRFKIIAPQGEYELLVSYSGYKTSTVLIDLKADSYKRITLDEISLDEVEIVSELPMHRQSLLGKIELSQKRILNLPTTFGEEDLIRVISSLPGVHASNKGQSSMSVRGGGRHSNLFLIDNVPVYNQNHLFGFLSMFNTDVIESIDFYKGGFPAKYGGYTSSVTDITLKAGVKDTIHAGFNIGLLKSKAYFHGKFNKKISYSIAARTSYVNLFYEKIRTILDFSSTSIKYSFYDLNSKIEYKVSDRHKISLASFYSLDDYATYDDSHGADEAWELKSKQGSAMVSLQSHFVVNESSVLKSGFSGTKLDSYQHDAEVYRYNGLKKGVRKYSVSTNRNFRMYSEWMSSYWTGHELSLGIELNNVLFSPSKFEEGDYNEELSVVRPDEEFIMDYALFVQDEVQLSSKSKLNAGLRFSLFRNEKTFLSLQPRLNYRYALHENYSFKVSYARMVQNLRSVDNNMQGLGKEFFLCSSELIAPEVSDLIAVGISGEIPDMKFEFSAELYYRRMQDQLYFLYNTMDNVSHLDLQNLVYKNGKGESKGFELGFKYQGINRVIVNGAYTLSRSTMQFDDLNRGNAFATPLDHLHDLKIGINYNVNKTYELNAQWVLASGNPITLPSAYVGASPYLIPHFVYDGLNSHRLPLYHRLDLSWKKSWKSAKGKDKYFSMNLYNAYFRINPTYMYFNGGKLKKVDVLPPLFSINYGVKF